QVMKRALQNSDILAELSERLIDDMKVQATRDIRKKVMDLDKAVAVISWIKKTSSAMLEDSSDYNKGFQKPNSTTWNKVIANSQSKRDQILMIDPDFLQEIETRFLSDVGNFELVNLKAMFLETIERKMLNKVKVQIRDINSFAYTIIAEDGIRSEPIAASGSTKFYFQPTVIGGVIPFANACALVDSGKNPVK
ncbi:23541_t:CDS:2, partial [Racocetra persica]